VRLGECVLVLLALRRLQLFPCAAVVEIRRFWLQGLKNNPYDNSTPDNTFQETVVIVDYDLADEDYNRSFVKALTHIQFISFIINANAVS
jgi:hypothetical protein